MLAFRGHKLSHAKFSEEIHNVMSTVRENILRHLWENTKSSLLSEKVWASKPVSRKEQCFVQECTHSSINSFWINEHHLTAKLCYLKKIKNVSN